MPLHPPPMVIAATMVGHMHVITTSCVSPAICVGLDPGIDHLCEVKTIGEVHDKGEVCACDPLKSIYDVGVLLIPRSNNSSPTVVASLPPECTSNLLGYKFSWSVPLVLLNDTTYVSMVYLNRNSVPFREWYGQGGEGNIEVLEVCKGAGCGWMGGRW